MHRAVIPRKNHFLVVTGHQVRQIIVVSGYSATWGRRQPQKIKTSASVYLGNDKLGENWPEEHNSVL